MFPIIDFQVEPWFEKYGETLDDPTTHRHMLDMTVKERDTVAALIPEYERAGFTDIMDECRLGIIKADALIEKLRIRRRQIAAELGQTE